MAAEVFMPKFGLTMLEGTIQKWFKVEGDAIKAGEALFEVETEKVLYEVEAPSVGTVAKLLYPAEAVVPVGLPVAVIAEPGERVAEVAERYTGRSSASPPVAASTAESSASGAAALAKAPRERLPVTPAARRLAEQHEIDLARVVGTGPGGRIAREDIQKVIDNNAEKSASAYIAPAPMRTSAPPPTRSLPLRGLRKIIADRMHKSLQSGAQLTITADVDVTEMVDRHQQVRREFNITYTDFLIQACAHALQQHPRMNAILDEDVIYLHDQINVGLAVALEEGLIVPVVHNADKKSLREIAQEAKGLVEKARSGRLTSEEVSGGTFTVSNLGMYGVDGFTPILNFPQVGILGVGRIVEKLVILRGETAKRTMMVLSLTFDHRAIDGAPAGAFLQTVAELLAHGNRISLDATRVSWSSMTSIRTASGS